MTEPGNALTLASILAAISAAAFVIAAFYPRLMRPPLSSRRSAMFEALLKGSRSDAGIPATRTVRRAQEAALRSVAHHGRRGRRSPIENGIAAAGLNWSRRFYLGLCLGLGAFLFLAAASSGLSPVTAITVGVLGAWLIPQRLLAIRANRRRRVFLAAFAPAVDMIVRGVKSGLSLMDCLSMVASDAPSPVRDEFATILAQLQAGVPLPTAMEKLSAAMPAPEVRFFVMIMSAQTQTGGNLGEALSNLSGVLRDREKIAAKIRIASAEGRASALIIGALPFMVIGAAAAFAPHYIAMLWTDAGGRQVAAMCAVWLFAGIFVLGRMARIEV